MSDWMGELKEFMDMAGKIPTPFDTLEVREAKLRAVIDEDLDTQRILKFAKQIQDIFKEEQDQ